MAQNIYDQPAFFEGYSNLPRSVHGLAGAAEWESVRALLPDLKGRRIVDLGCGFGWFARHAAAEGAESVLGLDLSENMIARAKAADMHVMIAAIEAENKASVALHERLGFRLVGIHREVGNKFGRWLDLAAMELRL